MTKRRILNQNSVVTAANGSFNMFLRPGCRNCNAIKNKRTRPLHFCSSRMSGRMKGSEVAHIMRPTRAVGGEAYTRCTRGDPLSFISKARIPA